jgi:hypothetical protein
MSLVGSLEDLGLADILQIVSLAQKSGRLLLRSGADSGRILLRAGLVCGGAIKGERDNLRALLLEGEHLPPEQFEEASRLADDEGLSLVSAVARVAAMEIAAIEGLRREHTERSVMRMFGWTSGEFSFEVRSDIDPEDEELELTSGINSQYLAMEASRLRDEGMDLDVPGDVEERTSAEVAPFEDFAPDDPHDRMPLGAPAEIDGDSPIDALALASVRAVDADRSREDAGAFDPDDCELRFAGEDTAAEALASDAPVDAVSVESEFEAGIEVPVEGEPSPAHDETEAPAPTSDAEALAAAPRVEGELALTSVATVAPQSAIPAEPGPTPAGGEVPGFPVVAMDPDLSGLEWLKTVLAEGGRRVHIFQQAEPAMTRIRQYLVRGERPLVLVSPRIDGTFEAPEVEALVTRLRGLAPGMPVLELICEGRDVSGSVRGATGTVRRPMSPGHDPEGWFLYRPLAESLRTDIGRASRAWTSAVRRPDIDVLRQLKAVSQRLRNPQQEDVLSLVLEFAAESFERVAVFMLRDDQALGMVGRRLPAGASALRNVRWNVDELPELLHRAIVEQSGIHGDLTDPGNEGLFGLLGESAAPAYVAPIESGGCVAAVLYADAGAGGNLADTTALEIVLHEAGLALDRALLERTLSSR